MGLNDAFKQLLGGKEPTEADTTPIRPDDKRVQGKIIKVSQDEGWGFITSKEIKFTRIFFHWTSLRQDTLRFQDLHSGMKVEFTPVEVKDKGFRAIKIKVLKNDEAPTP